MAREAKDQMTATTGNSPQFQLYGALPVAVEKALRASIKMHGVLVPVAVDQHGRILDGHHRKRIAEEEGVECATSTINVSSEEQAQEIARTLNEDRRQLSAEERRPVVADLRAAGHSERAIADALGVSKSTVHKDLDQVVTGDHLPETQRATGKDGKSYPAKQKQKKKARKEEKPKAVVASREVEKLYESLKTEYTDLKDRYETLGETARELQDKLVMYETTEPDDQQKEIARLQKALQRKDGEIQRLRGNITDLNNKCNALIRQVKSLQKAK